MRILVALSLFLISVTTFGQCFTSPGNPIGGTANMGTLQKGIIRTSIFHKYNYADKYLEGHKASNIIYYDNAYYNYTGLVIGYGINNKFNIEMEGGYFFNKTVTFSNDYPSQHIAGTSYTGNGFSNGVITAKYNVYNNQDKRFEWTVAAGAKVPFSLDPIVENGVALPLDVQPSTGSFGYVVQSYLIKENSFNGFRFFLLNRFESNFTNNSDIKYGNSFTNSFFVSKHLWLPWTKGDGAWTAILQVKNEVKSKMILDYGLQTEREKAASGGYMFYIGPQLNMTLAKTWNISCLLDIPVYQYMNEIQLSNKYSILFNITKDLIFNKEIKKELAQP